jgi:iron complex outermembrane receptor protein
MKRIDTALRTGAAIGAMIAGATAAQAQSTLPPPNVTQATAEPGDSARGPGNDIVITGSRIRHNPLDQDSPVVFVDQQDIQKTGLNSVTDVLQRLPSAGGGLNSKFNNSGNFGNPPDGGGVGAGAAEIDLRYLGSKRTLVLVDGLRFVNATSASGVPGSVDINAIPESMIERVEVLQDGASAIYGSDAIAGVVNIITKRGQKGFLGSVQLGKYTQGDGFSQNIQASWGNSDTSPTRIVIGGNYVKQEPISSADRALSRFPEPYATSCAPGGCSSGTPLGRFILNFPAPDGQDLTLIAPVIGRTPTLADYRAFAGAPDRFNFAPYNYILTPLERYGMFANVRTELSSNANFTVKIVWNRRNSENQAAPLPLFVGPDAGNGNLLDTIVIDATNPFNPFGTLDASSYAFIGRRMIEGGPRHYSQRVDTIYETATFDGNFGLFGHDWYWDINGILANNSARQTVRGNINAAKLAVALGPVANCNATPGCVPFNIFGGVGSITQNMLDYVAFNQDDRSNQRFWALSANASGGLVDLPGGPLSLAAGVEHRRYKGRFDPDPIVAAGLGSDIPALPTRGGYDVEEAYFELNAPLLAHQPFAELLELNGAVRFSDYSTSGSTTTLKGSANWKPIRDLRLRGSYSEGFRAPTIGELFGTPSRFDQELADPCSKDQNPTGTILTNCQALFVGKTTALANYQQNNPQLSVLTSGNENLKPETSKGYNLGAVYSPAFLPRFSVEANYYNIKIKDAIFAAAGELLARCVGTLDPIACAGVTRTASGQIAQISGVLGNVNGINTDGLDVNLAYRTARAPWGSLGFTFNNTFLFNYDVIVPTAAGTATIKRDGTEQGSPDQAFPKHKAIAILDWFGNQFGASLTERFIRHVTESANGNELDDRYYTDVQLRWNPTSYGEMFGFALGANNLFNKAPPGCISCGLNNFDPTTYDVPGRYVYARLNIKMR